MLRANGKLPVNSSEEMSNQGLGGGMGAPGGQATVADIRDLRLQVDPACYPQLIQGDTSRIQVSDAQLKSKAMMDLVKRLEANPGLLEILIHLDNSKNQTGFPAATQPTTVASLYQSNDNLWTLDSLNTQTYQTNSHNGGLNLASTKGKTGGLLMIASGKGATVTGSVEQEGYQPPPGIKVLRYKTEMCRSVTMRTGTCRYGDKCQYAHSQEELRNIQKHPRYKTEKCRQYFSGSVCNYGPRCNFLHEEDPNNDRNVALRGSKFVPKRPGSAGSNGSADSGLGLPGKLTVGMADVTKRQISLESLDSLSPTFGEFNGPLTGSTEDDFVFNYVSVGAPGEQKNFGMDFLTNLGNQMFTGNAVQSVGNGMQYAGNGMQYGGGAMEYAGSGNDLQQDGRYVYYHDGIKEQCSPLDSTGELQYE